ncbi:hypothetical protein TNCV_2050361 [Trichonephila clavipes]|nr:hypothetical protein TNCV_2050361 [Trichonephila clavipes]
MARRGGDSLISRNHPWLWHWTVPGSTLWVFPRYLALKNLPAVTLGPLEKWRNSWPCGDRDGTGGNPYSQKKMETTKQNSDLDPERLLPPAPKKTFSPSWADRVESSTSSAGLHLKNSSPIEEQQNVSNARSFLISKTDTFSTISSFFIEKAIRASVVRSKRFERCVLGIFLSKCRQRNRL